jgi:fructokinase
VEDLDNLFGISEPERVYKREIEFYCKNFLCTDAGGDIKLITPSVKKNFKVEKINTVSTIGAGDNFNAGVVYGLIKYGIGRNQLSSLDELAWDKIIQCGKDLASNVCQSFNNSISKEFAEKYKSIG